MAFFGLTALGPQNTFAAMGISFRNLQIFDEEDFRIAWERTNGLEQKHCRAVKLGDCMRILFHGPVPPNDQKHILAAFEQESRRFESADIISYTDYIRIMLRLRDEAIEEDHLEVPNHEMKPSIEYTSSKLIQEHFLRHHRNKKNPQQKQTAALTSSQEVSSLFLCYDDYLFITHHTHCSLHKLHRTI
jgi:hypothetical protein